MDTEQNIPHIEDADYFAALLLKQLRQEITDNELQVLETWKASHPSFARVCEQVNDGEQLLADLVALKQIDMEGWWQKISEQVETVKKPVPLYRRWYTYAAAAVLLLAAGTITWRYLVPNTSPKVVHEQPAPGVVNVQPGGNRATLTLSDGAVINLTNAGNGKLAQEGEMSVVKLKDGEVKYEPANSSSQSAIIKYNTLSTPRGGQYSVILPDGSQVWLNAASSIKYPTQFAANERRVTITGEVYFEVVRGGAKKVPFIVTVQSEAGENIQNVEVMGTSFNIMAYEDEAAIKTTLLTGRVKVSATSHASTDAQQQSAILKPAQQAVLTHDLPAGRQGSKLTITDTIDASQEIGWKKGLVSLKNADIPAVMRLLSRWYNVDISYQGNIPAYTFTGTLPLKNNLSVVMQVLEYAGVHLNLQQNQNKIIVKP
jgi:transmembrane sensor